MSIINLWEPYMWYVILLAVVFDGYNTTVTLPSFSCFYSCLIRALQKFFRIIAVKAEVVITICVVRAVHQKSTHVYYTYLWSTTSNSAIILFFNPSLAQQIATAFLCNFTISFSVNPQWSITNSKFSCTHR